MQTVMKVFTWSPIIWKGGERKEKNFQTAHYVGLDFENPEVTVEGFVRSIEDCWHIVGTTRNHQKEKDGHPPVDRFRALLKFEQPITDVHDYRDTVTRLIDRHGADESCCDGARLFFPCRDIVSVQTDVDLYLEPVFKASEDAKKELELMKERHRENAAFHNSNGRLSTFCRKWLLNEIPQGKRSVTCFALGKDFCMAGIDYEDAVYRILCSPTYANQNLPDEILKKIRSQVYYGYRAVYKEMRDMKEKGVAPM